MTSELAPIDLAERPDLAALVEEVAATGKRRRFTRGDQDIAVLQPVDQGLLTDAEDADAALDELARRRRQGLSIVAATAGIVQYDGPTLTREQEKDTFVQGVADEVTERWRG